MNSDIVLDSNVITIMKKRMYQRKCDIKVEIVVTYNRQQALVT